MAGVDVTLVKKNAVELDLVPGRGRDELITRTDSLVEDGRFG